VKKNAEALDLGIIRTTTQRAPAAAGCFTRNAFKAAPVLVAHEVLALNEGRARAIVVNSGCANAVTGKTGYSNAWSITEAVDQLIESPWTNELSHIASKIARSDTLPMSTGVIGQQLPIEKILSAISSPSIKTTFSDGFEAWERVARAFMTTDTFPKLRARSFIIRGKEYRMAGIDKGAGMIHPSMGPVGSLGQLHATLLGCIVTDAAVSPRSLQSALTYAVDRSFNAISVDGDMSTNDTIVAIANGAVAEATGAAVEEIDEESDPKAYEIFKNELTSFATDLAQLVVRDGEGATKFVTVTVDGAPTFEDASKVASRISTSALVKTALYGEDANWGRILAATGSIPLSRPIDPTRVSVSFIPSDGSETLPLLVRGEPQKVDEDRASEIISAEDLEIYVELGLGKESAKYWTCDFSYEYVRINGDYRS